MVDIFSNIALVNYLTHQKIIVIALSLDYEFKKRSDFNFNYDCKMLGCNLLEDLRDRINLLESNPIFQFYYQNSTTNIIRRTRLKLFFDIIEVLL